MTRSLRGPLVLVGFAALLFGSVAESQPPVLRSSVPAAEAPVSPVWVEHPEALAHFHRALEGLRRDRGRTVRVMHFGDSNVAADLWTHVARESLQQRFGAGGSGYLLPRGHGSWHRGGVRVRAEGRWLSRRRGFARDFGPDDGLWGLAGVGVEPEAGGARLRLDVPAGRAGRRFELHALGRTAAGRLAVKVDDGDWQLVDLRAPSARLVLRRWSLDAGAHVVQVRHAGGRPRLLGLVVEEESGVVYDVLGINGHRASAILHWNEPLLRAQLSERRPDLVVLSYGGNEALDPNLPLDTYAAQTRLAVEKIRALAPQASCLLVGPLATYPVHAARMSAVTAIQRSLAPSLGCAFWDSSQTSGGPGTLRRWGRYPGMVSGDHLHLGPQGYERVGREFAEALLRGL